MKKKCVDSRIVQAVDVDFCKSGVRLPISRELEACFVTPGVRLTLGASVALFASSVPHRTDCRRIHKAQKQERLLLCYMVLMKNL